MRRLVRPSLLALLSCFVAGDASGKPGPFPCTTYTYKTAGKTAIQADVHRPADDKERPVVVWIHGGALIVGSRKGVPGRLLDFCRREGYTLVSLDYRLAPEVKLPEIAEDLRDAFAWIHEKGPKLFGADTSRVVVAGGSAGGYLTLLAGTLVKPRPRALVAYWGYGDVDGDWYTKPSAYYRKETPLVPREEAEKAVGKQVLTNTDVSAEVRNARGRYYRYLRQNGLWTRVVTGFDPGRERAKIDPFCPVRNVSPDFPPTLLVHGTTDTDVPYEQTAAMARELTRQKVPHELVTVRGAGHGLAGGDPEEVARAHEKALDFIRKQIQSTSPRSTGGSTDADKEVYALLEPIRAKYKIPGLVGALVRGDQFLASGAVGVRKHGSPEPITVHDQIHIGSCTKAMTATLLALLVQEKHLRWDSTLAEVFPKEKDKFHPDYHEVMLTHLLTHRAGLPANVGWWTFGLDKTATRQRVKLLRAALTDPPKHAPGTTFHYSNVGYVVAGLMAEKVTGRSWESLMHDRLFKPLEMKSAGFGAPGTEDMVDQPWGHTLGKDSPRPRQADNPAVMGPAGTVHCSLDDWAKFLALHLQKPEGEPRLLTARSLTQLHTAPDAGEQYAMGWIVVDREWAGGQSFTHEGSNTMWYAIVWVAPERNLVVLVAANMGGKKARAGCDKAVEDLEELYRKRFATR